LGTEEKKTEVREYSSKHQGLGVSQVDASTLYREREKRSHSLSISLMLLCLRQLDDDNKN
jgi:hypothetical protein